MDVPELLLLVFWMGIYPESFLAPIRPTVQATLERVAAARELARDVLKIVRARAAHDDAVFHPTRKLSGGGAAGGRVAIFQRP